MAAVDAVSGELLGRYQALRVYSTIGRLPKPAFTTGRIASLSGVSGSPLSKELGRLVRLGVVRSASRRGDYERVDLPAFWEAIELLAGWAEKDPV
jgi:hypothetical protein